MILDANLRNAVAYRRLHSSTFYHNEASIKEFKEYINLVETELKNLEKTEDKKDLKKDENSFTVYIASATRELKRLSLSKDTVYHLQNSFSDVHKVKDDTFLLSAESAAYVNGWYKEVAFSRKYEEADKNKDGYINDDEFLNLKSYFHEKFFYVPPQSHYITYAIGLSRYQSLSKENEAVIEKIKHFFVDDSLNTALDKTLLLDKDLDGLIRYKEALSPSDSNKILDILMNEGLHKIVYAEQEDMDRNEFFELMRQMKKKLAEEAAKRVEEKFDIVNDEETRKKEEIRVKLLSKGLSSLNADELRLARKYFANLLKKIDEGDFKNVDALIKDLKTNLKDINEKFILDKKA